ncbi:MAG TPA: hypothetical protein VMM59_01465 [Thermohalobaculum sp.]|nr:hypothetical protein [Thermohalobaculum sp.]
MPIRELDPWRQQYFEGVACPEDLVIPTDDGDAWGLYPDHRWVYDKLKVAESQSLVCGPHGIEPPGFPVFSKPAFNLRGMGTGSRVLRSLRDYRAHQRPGHIWMALLEGAHVSTDAAVVDGAPRWWRHAVGEPIGQGMFDHWTVLAGPRPEVEAPLAAWLARHLRGYTGIVNFETIGATIIEVHLRFADQWPDLYGGHAWVEAVVRLYRDGVWDFDDGARRPGYSVALFGAHGLQYRHPPRALLDEVLGLPGATSVQVTFHEDRPPAWHAMPPGGFRLAIINGWDLATARAARERLALSFWSTQSLAKGRRRKAPPGA